MLPDEFFQKFSAWFADFSCSDIVAHIRVLERLIDSPDFGDSLLIDDGIRLLELLREEFVRRVAVLSAFDNCSRFD